MFTRRSSGLDLGPLTQQDSISLFNHLTANSSEPEDGITQQISEILGGVPLAIAQMAGLIRRQDLTMSEFFELYMDHEEHASLYETKFDTNLVTYKHSLSTVWALEKLKPQSQQLLELMSFVDPDVMGEELLMEMAVNLLQVDGAHFKKSNYIDARTDLLQSSLIKRDKKRQQVSVHRIIQDVVLATMDEAKKQLTFNHALRALWASWPSAMPKPSKDPELPPPRSTGGRLAVGRWPDCAAIYPHVLKLHQIWLVMSNPSDATKMLFAKLLTEAAWYAYNQQAFFLLCGLILPGTKRSVDEQKTSTAFSKPLAVSVSLRHTQIEIRCLQTSTSAWDLSPWMRATLKRAAFTKRIPSI
jgi:hypothetical protein